MKLIADSAWMRSQERRPAPVLIDRDGVLVRMRPDYVKSWSEVEILPGALAGLARLRAAGHRVAVVTNQACIGRGLVTADAVAEINKRLADEVRSAGGAIESFHVCPHLPDEGCSCRKPKPGLLLEAAERLGANPTECWLIGDQLSDIEAARAAGCRPLLVGERPAWADADLIVCAGLAESAELITQQAVVG